MNRKIHGCIGGGVLLSIGNDAGRAGRRRRIIKVEELEKQMRHAQMNNDATWYQQHLADGYVEGHSWGEWATKADAIKQMQDKSIKSTKGGVSDVKVATFGDNTAIAHYKFTYDATFNGTHRARSVICSDTWVSHSGEWKLASNHCSHVEGT